MKTHCITFIGGGNMAHSLIGGLIEGGSPAKNIRVADPDLEQRQLLEGKFGITSYNDSVAALTGADVVLLAVKPQVMGQVVRELASYLEEEKPLIISIAAGIEEDTLRQWLWSDAAIVRTMPNTPALVQSGATALYANKFVSKDQHSLAESIMRSVGITLWIEDEQQMDAVTALSGSGPAYFFLLMEILDKAGQKLGLPPETSRLLTLQTAFGAAKMDLETVENSAELRKRVTSPGGTTEQAVKVLESGNLQELFEQALVAAKTRSQELAEELKNS